MKIKIVLFAAVLLSAFGSPGAPQTVHFQETVQPTTVVVEPTPGAIPVTGAESSSGMWIWLLLGLLGLLGLAFVVALFSPRATHEPVEPVLPHDHHHDGA